MNTNNDKLLYPISINYGKKDWDVVSALREFLSNMLDTKCPYTYYYENGVGYISDTGKGLTKKDFIFGESTRDESQIGQFGEGMKMALITLLRNNRKVEIITAGFTVHVNKVYSPEYESEIMLLEFEDNDRELGTLVKVECSKEEFYRAVNLFLQLRNDLEKLDEGIYFPAGDVFVMGLKTTSLANMLFSYNMKDKSMTNRDRNIIATEKLQDNIIKVLANMKNIKAISVYLKNFETNPTAYEYQLGFLPKYKEQWLKALKKIYKDKCVLSSDLKSDIKASAMGYKVFRNIPYHVEQILKYLGIAYSNVVAKEYKGEGILDKEKIVYPISTDYCSFWTIKDAIREFIANAIDTKKEVKIEYKNGKGRIIDTGDGIKLRNFIFGISNKEKDNIGQFGEGLKIASLVLARNKRKVEITTTGYTYYPTVEHNKEFDAELFTVYYKKNQRKNGTIISFECDKDELEEAKNLFLHFKKNKNIIETEQLDIIPDESTNIYVNGLLTASLRTVFGYNIKDKKLVSTRDRNAVDTILLNQYIRQFLKSTNNEKIIEDYLKKWENSPFAIEYSTVPFIPDHPDTWIKIGKKLFKNKCLESYDPEENFIAKQAGYELLKEVPSNVRYILSLIKVKTAEEIAKKYKNKGIVLENKIVYPITTDYAKNWSIVDAIRELIANALDTETKVSIGVKDGQGYIIDKGDGIEKKNLLFGNSNKGDSQIGQFGEGLKMATLVLARNGRNMKVITRGFEYVARIERDKEFDSDVLVLYLKKSKKRKGTEIYFDCTEKELDEAKNMFLIFNKEFKQVDEGIYEPRGYIFVNGVLVEKVDSLYSYNLIGAKKVLSRDRKSINTDAARKEIAMIIGRCSNEKFITRFLSDYNFYHLEQNLDIHISSVAKPEWKKVMKKKFNKHCLSSGTEYDLAAMDRGYKILSNISPAQERIFLQLGMPYSHNVATLRGDELLIKERASEKDLSEEGRKRWKKALRKFKKLYGEEIAEKVEIVKEFNHDELSQNTLGYYNERNDTVYVLMDVIENYSFSTLMGVLIHEHIHRISGAPDRTREFENALSEELGRITELYV